MDRLALARAVEIDHVKRPAPCSANARAWATGSSLNTVDWVEVALAQTHRLAALEVDRRVERDHEWETDPGAHRGEPAREQPQPGDARLLRVELHAQHALAPRGRAELGPWEARPSTRRSSSGSQA